LYINKLYLVKEKFLLSNLQYTILEA